MRKAALAALLLAGPLAAQQEPPAKIDYSAERAAIGRYQDADQRLQDVGWTLAKGNAPFCPVLSPSIGLQLQDMASYGEPAVARKALGLKGNFAVQTAARGSPAALSGGFARNREIVRLVALDPNTLPAKVRFDWERLARAHEHAESLLKIRGFIEIGFADGGSALVQSVPVCATRFELMGDGDKAVADGSRVVLGVGFAITGILTFRKFRTAVLPHRPATVLVDTGIYAYTRNPMYTGLTVAYLGGVLLTGVLWVLILLPIVLTLLVTQVIRREERYLRTRFPEAYAAYCTRVGRWF